MPTQKGTPYRGIALAKRLFARALANGTLKPPGGIAVLVRSNGRPIIGPPRAVTFRDYIVDARRMLCTLSTHSPSAAARPRASSCAKPWPRR